MKIFFTAGCMLLLVLHACTATPDDGIVSSGSGGPALSEGEELFKANCITCHTLRYIEMQPDFPRKTWEKITDKMIKNFGAPIPDSSAKKIVDYLVEIKGLKDSLN